MTALVTSVVATGTGITAGAGDLNAGHLVKIEVNLDSGVTVASGVPTLTLNNHGTAVYDAALSTSTKLVFDYTTATGQDISDLEITQINLNSATVTAQNDSSAVNLVGNSFLTNYNPAGILHIDTVAPQFSSFALTDATTSAAGSVHYTVAFAEAVTGVTAADFNLTTTGAISSATVSGVSTSDNIHYTVTVDTGTGSGNVSLGFATNATIFDEAGNGLAGGTLAPTQSISASGGKLFTGDTNSDGKTDLITVNGSGNIQVSTSNGNGFATGSTAGSGLSSVAVADLNGDGVNEFIVGGAGIFTTNPSLSQTISFQALASGGAAQSILTGDLNGDGKLDVVAISNRSGGLPSYASVGLGDGSTNLQPLVGTYNVGAGIGLNGAALGDFNNDGKLDLIGTSGSGAPPSGVNILLGNGDGTFQASTEIAFEKYSKLYVADLNNDGNLDFVAASLSNSSTPSNYVSVFLGNGNGTFATPVVYTTGATGTITRSAAVADINGDGKLDIVTGNFSTSTVSVLYGNGDGTFQTAVSVAAPANVDLVVADFNGDGRPDVADAGSSSISVLSNKVSATSASYTIDRTPPAVNSVTVSGTDIDNGGGGTINAGHVVSIVLNMSEATTVAGGVPTLALNDGGTATYVSGSGTTALVFNYTVASGENVTGLAVTGADQHGATIADTYGNALDITSLNASFDSLVIDTTVPTVTSFTADGTLLTNAGTVTYDIVFSEFVNNLGVGDFTLNTSGLTGASIIGVDFKDGNFGTEYTVTVTTGTGDGTLSIALNDGVVVDFAANAIAGPIAATGTYTIDRTPPTVTISGASHVTAGIVDQLTFTFSETVDGFDTNDIRTTGGTLSSLAQVDGTHYTADFTPDVSDNLTATVTVLAPGLRDAAWTDEAGNDGFGSAIFAITGDTKAPGPVTIRLKADTGASASDHITNSATLTGTADPNAVMNFKLDSNLAVTNVKANTSGVWIFTPTVAEGGHAIKAYVTDGAGNETDSSVFNFTYDKTAPAITSISTTESGTVTSGSIHFLLHLGEDVVSSLSNASTLKLSDGGTAIFSAADSDAHTLEYIYTPKANENVAVLKVVSLNASGANAFADEAGNALNITGAANKATGLAIDTTDSGPTVTKIAALPASANLHTGDKVTFTVTLDEKAVVDVTGGAPTLTLDDGGEAVYTNGSGSNMLTFTYTVGAGDTDTAALKVTGIDLHGGTIKDSLGNNGGTDANATFANVHLDRTAPTVHGITHTDDGALALGEKSIIKIDLGEAVKVTDIPLLNLSDGVGTAAYSAADSDLAHGVVAFKFTATAGDTASSLEANSADLNGGSIKDLAGNAADLSGANGNLHLVVDTTAPTVSTVAAVGVQPHGVAKGGSVGIDVTVNDAVTIAGIPTLKMSDGGFATYTGADSGNTVLHFTYAPTKVENVVDLTVSGVVFPVGSSIKDSAGNSLDVTGIAGFDLHTSVDTIAPTVKSIVATPTHTGPLFSGDMVNFTLKTSEHVNVDDGVELVLSNGEHVAITAAVSDSDTLVFVYSIGNEATADLKIVGLDLSHGDFTDLAGNTITAPVTFDTKTSMNVYTWTGGSGDFLDPTHWTQGSEPSDGAIAQLAAGKYTVTMTGADHTLTALTLGAGVILEVVDQTHTVYSNGSDAKSANAGTIQIDDGATFLLHDITMANSGTIKVNAIVSDTVLDIIGVTTLNGGGKIVLADSDHSIIQDNVQGTLINVDNTISGAGHIGNHTHLTLTNQAKGLVNANGTHALVIDALDTVTNAGVIEATSTGGLEIDSDVNNSNLIQALGKNTRVDIEGNVTNTAKGVVLSSGAGAIVQLHDGTHIAGGTLKAAGGGIIQTDVSAHVTFDGSAAGNPLNLAGAVSLLKGTVLDLKGTINNAATFTDVTINSPVGIEILGLVTLNGAGNFILLNDTVSTLRSDGSDATLTNVGNTISGAGVIGDDHLSFVNQLKGVINANAAGHALTIDMDGAHHLSNAGLIEATAGGELHLTSTDIDNASTGKITAGAGSAHIELDDVSITGGTVSVLKGSTLETDNGHSSLIIGATVSNAGTISAADGDLFIGGGVANTGALSANGHHLTIAGTVTGVGTASVSGGGVLEFGDASTAKVTMNGGTLILDHATSLSAKFTGNITTTAGGEIDLGAIDFTTGQSQLSYTENATHTQGVLAATDGAHSISLTFLGDLDSSQFHAVENATTHHLNIMVDALMV